MYEVDEIERIAVNVQKKLGLVMRGFPFDVMTRKSLPQLVKKQRKRLP